MTLVIDAAALLAVWDHREACEARFRKYVLQHNERISVMAERTFPQNLGWQTPPMTERPRPGESVMRNSGEFAIERGGSSPKTTVVHGGNGQRESRVDRVGVRDAVSQHGQNPPFRGNRR
jgi:hypothetical protein